MFCLVIVLFSINMIISNLSWRTWWFLLTLLLYLLRYISLLPHVLKCRANIGYVRVPSLLAVFCLTISTILKKIQQIF
jgi:hypothetical protein